MHMQQQKHHKEGSMADKKYQISKILLIGDVGTGKTSFLTQLIHRVPERLPKPTTHLSVFTMRISKPPTVIQIWDSPGDAKYYFQTLGSISKFNAVLIFVDVTNEYTYERARIIADQIGVYANSGMDIHIIESKIEIVEKDPIKRKVSINMLRKIIDKYNGGIFQYRQSASVETIIQEIIEWKNKRQQLIKLQKQKQKQNSVPVYKQPRFESEVQTPNCECTVF